MVQPLDIRGEVGIISYGTRSESGMPIGVGPGLYGLLKIPLLGNSVNKALLVCRPALRDCIRTQPQRDVLGLHGLPNHPYHVVA